MSASSADSAPAPPLKATKAAYTRLAAKCQQFVAKLSADNALNSDQMRHVKTALNAISQDVFLTARRHLRVRGHAEKEDPSLPARLAQEQSEIKANQLKLHGLHVRAAQFVDAKLKAPCSHLDLTGRIVNESPLPQLDQSALPPRRRDGAAASEESLHAALRSGASEASAAIAPAVGAAADLSGVLSARGAQPLSAAVRATLDKVNKDVARNSKRGAKGKAAAAANPGDAPPGKVVKSPSARLSARLAAQPY